MDINFDRFVSFCIARRHELIGNCLNCGKIVCAQEGEGPCFFCKHEVRSNTAYQNFDQLSKETQVAIEHKNRLLEYDRNHARRTTVIGSNETMNSFTYQEIFDDVQCSFH
jgi:aspartate/glutamate racemase